MRILKYILLLTLGLSHHLEASGSNRHRLSIGPEVYHLKRMREGGTVQNGVLGGVRLTYDYLGRYLMYYGLDVSYASGTLKGKSGNGTKQKSHFSDSWCEGRLGYTFQGLTGCKAMFTPFIGLGNSWEFNNYTNPSPVHLHFRNSYLYFAVGALTQAMVKPWFTIGANITAKFSMTGKMRVSRDPEIEPFKLPYQQMIHCRVELPFTYAFCIKCEEKIVSFVPFFEYRHYGEQSGYPFDFLDTKIRIWGAELLYQIYF